MEQSLDEYEQEEGYRLSWVEPSKAIEVNLTHSHEKQANQTFTKRLMERETFIINTLIEESIL